MCLLKEKTLPLVLLLLFHTWKINTTTSLNKVFPQFLNTADHTSGLGFPQRLKATQGPCLLLSDTLHKRCPPSLLDLTPHSLAFCSAYWAPAQAFSLFSCSQEGEFLFTNSRPAKAECQIAGSVTISFPVKEQIDVYTSSFLITVSCLPQKGVQKQGFKSL